jgi:hypothetical protein
MGQGIEYEVPRVQIRGAFFVDDLAIPISIRGSILQEDWDVSDNEEVGDTSWEGDIDLVF